MNVLNKNHLIIFEFDLNNFQIENLFKSHSNLKKILKRSKKYYYLLNEFLYIYKYKIKSYFRMRCRRISGVINY